LQTAFSEQFLTVFLEQLQTKLSEKLQTELYLIDFRELLKNRALATIGRSWNWQHGRSWRSSKAVGLGRGGARA
jgi:hypothetical protein